MPTGWDNCCEDENNKSKPEVLHAEANALTKLAGSHESGKDATLFCTHSPCIDCAKLIYQTGITAVYYKNDYRSTQGIDFLTKSNIKIVKV
jgi:dCMP deaminase